MWEQFNRSFAQKSYPETHGIGHKRKKYMPLVVGEAYLGMARSIKKALDPNNVLNPGKIFDM